MPDRPLHELATLFQIGLEDLQFAILNKKKFSDISCTSVLTRKTGTYPDLSLNRITMVLHETLTRETCNNNKALFCNGSYLCDFIVIISRYLVVQILLRLLVKPTNNIKIKPWLEPS